MTMQGQNDVFLKGYLRYPTIRETRNGNLLFQGKIEVPSTYTDRKTGDVTPTSRYIKISAWGDEARELGEFKDGTPLQVQGTFNERSYNGNCKHCSAEDKKYWTDVLVNNFLVIEGEEQAV